MEIFKLLVNTATDYPFNPVSNISRIGITERYKKFVKKEKGNAPLPNNLVYNPYTNNIVSKKNKKFRHLKKGNKLDIIKKEGFSYYTNEVIKFEENLEKYILGEDYPNGIETKLNDYDSSILVKFIQKLVILDTEFIIKVGGKHYVINDKTSKKLIEYIKSNSVSMVDSTGSDAELLTAILNYDSFTVQIWDGQVEGLAITDDEEIGQNQVNPNGFFPFYHNLPLDLSRYGLFREEQEKNYDNCCIIEALINSGQLTDGQINIAKSKVLNRFINQRELELLSKELNGKRINIKRVDINKLKENESEMDDNDKTKKLKKNQAKNHIYPKGAKTGEQIKLGSVGGHAFIIDKQTGITGYALRNFGKHKSLLQINDKGKKVINRQIDSFQLISYLMTHKDKFLKKITKCDEIFNSVFYDKIKEYDTLEYGDNSTKLIEYKDKKEQHDWKIAKGYAREKTARIFFDFETDVYNKYIVDTDDGDFIEDKESTTQHVDYIVCMDTDKDIKDFMIKEGKQPLKIAWYKKKGKKSIAEQFLDYLYECFGNQEIYDLELYAHNLGYDFRFLAPHLRVGKSSLTIEKGTSSIITISGEYLPKGKRKTGSGHRSLKIKFLDTLALIPAPLRNFADMFRLDSKKEILPYQMYNQKNINKKFLSIEKCLSYIPFCDHKEFLSNCDEWGCFLPPSKSHINIIKYSVEYCKIDCKVLKEGYNKFRQLIKEATNLDSVFYLTLPSIASDYLKKEGCFIGCNSLAGIPRDFISDSAWGGRVMTKNNEKQILDFRNDPTNTITDLDEVSQYSSSMSRMEGFIMGTPKVIDIWEKRKNSDMFYIRIEILSVETHLDFPLLNYKDDKTGVRNYTNDMVGRRITVDKYTLQDLIKFHNIKYKFINGYYFDEKFNNKINETIRSMFYNRFQAKHQIKNIRDGTIRKISIPSIIKGLKGSMKFDKWIETQFDPETEELYKNPLQEVYKLLMNSAYGKMLLKPIDTTLHYVEKGRVKNHHKKYHHEIKCFEPEANGQYCKFTHYKPIDDHFNQVHIGSNILSIAKRMMMEVMTIAEELDMSATYTDTDSIHLAKSSVEPIRKEYNSRYSDKNKDYYVQKDLLGEDLGQFNLDLEIKNCHSVVSNYGIWLAKKSYIHQLKGNHNKSGKIIDDYHIRMKGVPSESIKWKSTSEYNGNTMKIYEDLYNDKSFSIINGEKVSGTNFDLLKNKDGGLKIRFQFHGDMTISSKTNFQRKVRFPSK